MPHPTKTATCAIEGCVRTADTGTTCMAHRQRARRGTEMSTPLPPKAKCLIDGCGRTKVARGWCLLHWKRWRKHNDPTVCKVGLWDGTCPRCGVKLPSDRTGTHYCKKCSAARSADRVAKNHEQVRTVANRAMRKMNRKLRGIVLAAYGPVCTCCGEDEEVFLTIDHVNNDGVAHRKEIGAASISLYRWLQKNNFPSNFQILCRNCNWAKYRGGCPHQRSKSIEEVDPYS